MNSASHGISVTLCCALEDADHLRPLAEHLSELGLPTTLLTGVESDPLRLGPALDLPGARLYVVCLGEALGPPEHRRIAGVYSARKGPEHHLAELFVEPDETLAMAETIHTALAKINQSSTLTGHPKQVSNDKSNRLRDVVGVTDISAVGSDAIPSRNTRIPKKQQARERAPVCEDSVSRSYAIDAAKLLGHERSAPKEDPPASAPQAAAAVESEPEPTPAPKLKPVAAPAPAARSSRSIVIVLFVLLLAVAGTVALVNS